MGWWVAHKILVSAPVPLELIGIWVWLGWGWVGFGDGLDNSFKFTEHSFLVCWTKRLSLVIHQCIRPWFESSVQLAPSYSNQAEKIKPLVTNPRFSQAPSPKQRSCLAAVFAWRLHSEVNNLYWKVLWETILILVVHDMILNKCNLWNL